MAAYFDDIVALLRTQIAQSRENIFALCSRLVAADSVNPPGDTRRVAHILAAELHDLGLEPRLVARDETMPNVLVDVDSGRPGRHLVLNAHMDTMPPGDSSAWTFPPRNLTPDGDRLYGLGIGNMKGAAAAMVYALAFLSRRTDDWCGKITFTAVSDEVVFGDNGAAHILDSMPGIVGDGLLCGEGPGFKRLAIGEKGVLWLRLRAEGPAGHSSAVEPLGSAASRIATAISRIDRLNGLRAEPPGDVAHYFADDDPGFILTANVGTLAAGTFIGQIATEGSAEIDFRIPPGMRLHEVEEKVRDICREVGGISVERIKGWEPNWTSPDCRLGRAWSTAHVATARHGRQAAPEYAIRLPASDASRWRLRGTDSLCYGPQSLFSAGIDEYVEADEILRCTLLYASAAISFLEGDTP